MVIILKTCPICKKEFEAYRKDKIFCSKNCTHKNWRNKNPKRHYYHSRKWRLKNKEYYRNYMQRRERRFILRGKNNEYYRVIKREYPKNNHCELCEEQKKRLNYHHCDDNDLQKNHFVKGIWICIQCHQLVESIERYSNWNKLIKKYLYFKSIIKNK